jgi:hypothetical protein
MSGEAWLGIKVHNCLTDNEYKVMTMDRFVFLGPGVASPLLSVVVPARDS